MTLRTFFTKQPLLVLLWLMCCIVYCCGCKCYGLRPNGRNIYIEGDSGKKIAISYYDNGDRNDSVVLPYYNAVSVENKCDIDRFYLKICDSSTAVRAVIYEYLPLGDSCDLGFFFENKVHPQTQTGNINISSKCFTMTTDSVFKYLKRIHYQGYLETKTSGNNGCQTVYPN